MTCKIILVGCLVLLSAILKPAQGDASALGDSITTQTNNLSGKISAFVSEKVTQLVGSLPATIKSLVEIVVNPTFIQTTVNSLLQKGMGSLIRMIPPSIPDITTFLNDKAKPFAAKYGLTKLQDLVTELVAFLADLKKYTDGLPKERAGDAPIKIDDSKFDIRTPFERTLADMILEEQVWAKSVAASS